MAESEGVVGRVVKRYEAVASTNETLKELLEEDVPEGAVVVAERQAAGKGRHGRAWFSPPGGLYCSILLEPPDRDATPLSLLAGIPVVKAVRHYGVLAYLRWPNDVHFMDRKIAGILGEGVYRRDRHVVVLGIGVNTNVPLNAFPEDLQGQVTSVQHEEGRVHNEDFLAYLLGHLNQLYRRYLSGTRDLLFREYRGLCTTIGRRVVAETAEGKVTGTAVEASPRGGLVILDEQGAKHEVLDATLRYL